MRTTCLIVLLCAAASGESWAPYTHQKHVAPDDGAHFETARASAITWKFVKRGQPNQTLAKGSFSQLPFAIHVRNGVRGVVLFEHYGAPGVGITLAYLKPDGTFAFRLKRSDILTKKDVDKGVSFGGNFWWQGWWVDEERNRVVLLTRDKKLKLVDLKTGKVTNGVYEDELLRAATAIPWASATAFGLIRTTPSARALDALGAFVKSDRAPAIARLRAAVILHERKRRQITREDFDRAAAQPRLTKTDWSFVCVEAQHLPEEDAVDLLEALAANDEFETARLAVWGLMALGTKPAGAAVVRLISHGDVSVAVRKEAARAAGQMKPETVLERILRDLGDVEHDLVAAGRLLEAAFALDPAGLSKRVKKHRSTLVKVLGQGGGPTDWLIAFFAENPTTEAVKPLLRTLQRHRNDPRRRQLTIIALRQCSGQDHGDDVDAWLTKTAGR
ncbi:MAG: HEAT repeat domain-containing protein [Planctomycetota bacterium]|nr:HEAT repeat domain-containing protein [Planctomycetota bacterium]